MPGKVGMDISFFVSVFKVGYTCSTPFSSTENYYYFIIVYLLSNFKSKTNLDAIKLNKP